MMNLKRIIIISTIVISFIGHTNAAVYVDKFTTNAYGINDIPKSISPKTELALKILQISYKAHLDEVRAKKHPYLLQNNGYKYFLSVYDVIFNEISKMKLSVIENGNSVYYDGKNENEIIKCNFAKNITRYNRSNWNYIILVNVLNQVKNSDKQIDINLIKDTAKHIAKDSEYKIYQEKIKSAEYDVTQYFEQLDLYKYLTAVREFDFDTMYNNLKEDYELEFPECNKASRNYDLNNLSINVTTFDISITKKTNSWERIVLSSEYYMRETQNGELFDAEKYSWSLFENPRGLYFSDSLMCIINKINLPKLDLKQAYSWENILYDIPNEQKDFAAFFVEFFKPAFLSLLKKACTGNIDRIEKLFLDMYSQYKYQVFCCNNMYKCNDRDSKQFIHFACNDNIAMCAYDIMKRVEDELLCGMKSNASIDEIRHTCTSKAQKCIEDVSKKYLDKKYAEEFCNKFLNN